MEGILEPITKLRPPINGEIQTRENYVWGQAEEQNILLSPILAKSFDQKNLTVSPVNISETQNLVIANYFH